MNADPTLVFDLATAFWRSSVLFAACELGIFDLLDNSEASSKDIVKKIRGSDRGVYALLESCVALGLLEKKAGQYKNTDTASMYLTGTGKESLLVTLRLQAATVPMWLKLKDAVLSGKPVMPPSDMLGRNKDLTRHFVLGMHQRALGVAKAMVDEVDLSGAKVLADIGGGPGTYSVMLVKKYPKLVARVMDLAPVLEITRELIDASGVGDRITTVAFDAGKDDLSGGFDAALVSGFLHRLQPEGCVGVLKKVFNALPAGGSLIVNDLFAAHDGPEMAVLFGLQMLLTNDTGRTHSVDDMVAYMQDAGFVNIRTKTLPPPLPHSLVMGVKHRAS